jgi:SAM-dependent methyltransferase
VNGQHKARNLCWRGAGDLGSADKMILISLVSRMPTNAALNAHDLKMLSPSPLVKRFASQIVAAAKGRPILDVACGAGRNAILLSHLGGNVVCIDNDLQPLETQRIRFAETIFAAAFRRIRPYFLDLRADDWPFKPNTVGGLINVHFLNAALFPAFNASSAPGSCLLLETVAARGGNYFELPKANSLKAAFENFFTVKVYKERKAGPVDYDAVTVQLFGTKLNHRE